MNNNPENAVLMTEEAGKVEVEDVSVEVMLISEASEELLERQKKKNRITSMIVTCLVYAGIIFILALIAIPGIQQDAPQIRAKLMVPVENQVQQRITQMVRASPSSHSSSAKLISVSSVASQVYVPMVEVETEMLAIGDEMQLGMGFGGSGAGIGTDGLGNIHDGFRGRCSPEERMKRLRDGGGNQAVEDAIVKGLRYFKKTQNGNGSWGQGNFRAAYTGLVLLCFLAHCETPASQEYGDTVTRAMTFLISTAIENDGYISTSYGRSNKHPYEHAIGLYALCEALTFTKALQYPFPNLEEVCERGVEKVLEKQHRSGAWDYGYNVGSSRGGDTSILVWHLQALKAAEIAGIRPVRMRSGVDRAFTYLNRMANADGFLYTAGHNTQPPHRLSGAGAFCYQLWGKGNERPVRDALRRIERLEMNYNSNNALLYAWYYNANAAFQQGGASWVDFNKKWRDTLLSGQKDDGSWRQEGAYGNQTAALTSQAVGRDNQTNGEIYRTSLAVLQLCVYYRFLPTGR